MLPDLSRVQRRQAISLTPLIDVVFILLLFFMLSSSFIKLKQINLPAATQAAESSDDVLLITLHAGGTAFSAAGQRYDLSDRSALTDLIMRNPHTIFALDVEPQVSTQSMLTLLDNFKRAGALNVSLTGVMP
ncbi:biopolymer transporter ExbD [uncultured Amphritea sp.]|uniref:ExbD/TolR family protein n=1 Tax=uncultured Amphritea sp. TaxID=981605 RepID=UPI0026383DE9|nr:biopolymer transporter ExbD [uncultured Amphritea sp.]